MSRHPQVPMRLVTLALVGTLLAGCSPSGDTGDQATTSDDRSASGTPTVINEKEQSVTEITTMLEHRAKAVNKGNRKAFLRTVDASQKKFAAKQRVLFGNLETLPIKSFDYNIPAMSAFDIDTATDDRMTAEIIEDVRLNGPDHAPVSNSVDMAFVRRGGDWVVTQDSAVRSSEGDIQSRPWSGGSIAVANTGKAVVVVDKELEGELDGLVASVEREIPSIAETLDLKPRFDLLVDATNSGRRTKVGGRGKETASAVAFTVYTRRSLGQRATQIAGQRIKLDPRHVEELIDSRVLLRHELSHFLTKGTTDAPQWTEEGLAEYVSYYPARPSGLVVPAATLDRALGKKRALPVSNKFGLDPQPDYLISHSAATYLIDTFGMKKFTRFRLSYKGSNLPPDWQTRERVRKAYGISMNELLDRTWATLDDFHRG